MHGGRCGRGPDPNPRFRGAGEKVLRAQAGSGPALASEALALAPRPAPATSPLRAANQPLGAGKGRAWAPEGAVPPPPRLPGLLLVPWGSWTVSRIQCSAHSFVNVD